jgi:tetratricopeptide (TPR) repeat protein
MSMRVLPCLVLIVLLAPAVSAQDLAHATERHEEVEKLYREGEKAYNAGGYAKAIGLFSAVLEREPDHLNAYLQRGFCHSLQREYELAVADFSAVIERKNDHVWAYTSRGSAYNSLGKPDLAMRDFDAVLGLDPKNQEAYNNRGWSKKALGDAPGACQDWKTSKKLGNGEAKIILENNRCK